MSAKQGFLYIYLFAYLIFGLFSILLSPGIVTADNQENCQPIYGGGESCVQKGKVAINKTVRNPQTLQYVENLGVQDPKYSPNQTVQFQITVKNTSNTPIGNIEIKDRLPQYLDCASEVSSQCNNATKIITFTIDNLNANEIKIYTFKGKVASINNLSEDKEAICLVNQALATQNKQTSQDNSLFCIQKNEAPSATTQQTNPGSTKGGLPVYPPSRTKSTPGTGPETVALFGLLASGLFGFMLRQKR